LGLSKQIEHTITASSIRFFSEATERKQNQIEHFITLQHNYFHCHFHHLSKHFSATLDRPCPSAPHPGRAEPVAHPPPASHEESDHHLQNKNNYITKRRYIPTYIPTSMMHCLIGKMSQNFKYV